MGDPLLKVHAGDPLAISADTINTLIDVARDARGNAMQIGAAGQNLRPGVKALWIQNTTSDYLKAGQVLGIDTAVQAKDLLVDEYLLKGVKPSRDHIDNFVVLLEPVGPNQVALAASDGLVMASINWKGKDYCVAVGVKQDSYDLYAPTQSDADEAKNGTTGGDVLSSDTRAMVLWAKDDTGLTTGLIRMWSFKKIDTPQPDLEHALLDGNLHQDTVPHTPAAGDVIRAVMQRDANGNDTFVAWDALAAGGNGSVMVVDANLPTWKNPPQGVSVFTFNGGCNWTAAGANGALFTIAGGNPGWLPAGGAGSMLYVNGNVPDYLASPAGFSVMTFSGNSPTWKAPDDNDPALFMASGGAASWLKIGAANSILTVSADGTAFTYLWPPVANPGADSLLRFDGTSHWSYFTASPGKALVGVDANGALIEYYGDAVKMGLLAGGCGVLEFSSPDEGPAVPWIDTTNNVQWAKAAAGQVLSCDAQGVIGFAAPGSTLTVPAAGVVTSDGSALGNVAYSSGVFTGTGTAATFTPYPTTAELQLAYYDGSGLNWETPAAMLDGSEASAKVKKIIASIGPGVIVASGTGDDATLAAGPFGTDGQMCVMNGTTTVKFVDAPDLSNYATVDDLNGYVTTDSLTTTLANYVLASALSGYVTTDALNTALGSYVTAASLTTTLANYVLSSDLTTTLSGYVTSDALTTALGNYVLSSALTATLADYVLSSTLASTLAGYVTSDALATALANYVLSSALSAYVTTDSLNTALGSYVLSSALTTTLGDYALRSSIPSNAGADAQPVVSSNGVLSLNAATTVTQDYITGWQFNSSTKKFQVKTRTLTITNGLSSLGTESDWTDATGETTTCTTGT